MLYRAVFGFYRSIEEKLDKLPGEIQGGREDIWARPSKMSLIFASFGERALPVENSRLKGTESRW